jgi:hypothetical protein
MAFKARTYFASWARAKHGNAPSVIDTLRRWWPAYGADTVERWGVQQSQITVTYRFAEPSSSRYN